MVNNVELQTACVPKNNWQNSTRVEDHVSITRNYQKGKWLIIIIMHPDSVLFVKQFLFICNQNPVQL